MKLQSLAFATLIALLGFASSGEAAAQANMKSIAAIHKNKDALAGKQTANVDDDITIFGMVVLHRDFEPEYMFPRLIGEATISPTK